MTGLLGHWRWRLAAPALALGILGAAIALPATTTRAQVWGPWEPLPGWDTDFSGPMPGPLLGPFPMMGPGPMPGATPMLGPTEMRVLGTYLRMLGSVNHGNGADATSLFADDGTYWFSDGVGNCSATPCVGRAAIGPELERQIGQHARFAPLGGDVVGNVGGSTVTGLWDIRSDRVTAASSERVLGTITAEVRNDRIVSLRITLVRDDPQTQRFIAWVATQAGGAAAATPTATAPFAAPTVAPAPMPASAQ
ncbi:MAG TPA: hypothetical protein VK066_24315 [Chloroflexota bacterium]|nr:hypothetical protein [Chloroflexota bacterium]